MRKVTFLLSKKFGLEALVHIAQNYANSINEVITIDDTFDSRSALNEILNFCKQKNISHKVMKNNSEFKKYFASKKNNSEIVFVLGWYWIIDEEILNLVAGDFIGIHYSLLPKYRGGSPLVWSLINGDTETGVTMFCFRKGIDDGPIIAQEKILIDYNDNVQDLLDKCDKKMIEILHQYYSQIINKQYTFYEQNDSLAIYCSNRKEEFGKINWNWDSNKIYNFVRAQTTPYPGAFCFNERGDKIRILKSKISHEKWFCEPGQIIKIDKNNQEVYIGTGTTNPVVIQKISINNIEYLPSNYFKSIKEILL